MRPLFLRMSAVGPYAGEVTVDMEKLGDSGLYLITGDTGAGKTTIFDGIAYALFGKTSGSIRNDSMMRSTYALPETPTEVELIFEYRGKRYRVKRNPAYERPKIKGKGSTSQPPGAELTYPDGRVVTSRGSVDEEIKNLLGIDYDRFTQIAMIAQGDFMKLLLASTDDRKKIFREIFRTHRYGILQDRLKAEVSKLEQERRLNESSLDQCINSIECPEKDMLYGDLEKVRDGLLPKSEADSILEKLIEKDSISEGKLKAETEETDKQLILVSNRIIQAENRRKTEASLDAEKKELEQLSGKIDRLSKALQAEKAKIPEIEKLRKDSAAIRNELPEYEELDNKTEAAKAGDEFISSAGKELEEKKKLCDSSKEEIAKCKAEKEALDDLPRQRAELSAKLEKAIELKEKLSRLDEHIRDIYRYKSDWDNAKAEYSRFSEKEKAARDDYNRKYRAYLDDQAGIIAETVLKEGSPCPVCGSLEHPHAARKSENAPTKEELDRSKVLADKALKDASDASIRSNQAMTLFREKKANAEKEAEELFHAKLDKNIPQAVKEKLPALDKSINELNVQIQKCSQGITKRDVLAKQLPVKETSLEKLRGKISALENSIASRRSENAQIKKRIEALSEKLRFESAEQASDKADQLDRQIREAETLREQAEKDFNECDKQIASLKALIVENTEKLRKEEPLNGEKEKLRENELKAQKQSLDGEYRSVSVRLEKNLSTREKMRDDVSRLSAVEEKLKWVRSLSETANGQINGKEKIMLETYIQMTFFDRMITRANTRLMIMSNGQYELKRRKEAVNNHAQSGLELNVIDHYNGSERSVRSLSGGESFKASLSLALGLSDEIQSFAGGIRLDTMFVDEGFGSLDNESLEQAVKALYELTEGKRLVGIISHVSELKERIDKQIIITKNKTGGSSITIRE